MTKEEFHEKFCELAEEFLNYRKSEIKFDDAEWLIKAINEVENKLITSDEDADYIGSWIVNCSKLRNYLKLM